MIIKRLSNGLKVVLPPATVAIAIFAGTIGLSDVVYNSDYPYAFAVLFITIGLLVLAYCMGDER